MKRKTLDCLSCETKTDVVVRYSNFEDDDVEVIYCPVCSSEVIDLDEYGMSDDNDGTDGME